MTGRPPGESPDDHAGPLRWRMLALLSGAMLLSLSAWMTATAVAPELQARWSLSDGQVGLLTTVVQLGFVVGTALGAVLNLGDIIPRVPAHDGDDPSGPRHGGRRGLAMGVRLPRVRAGRRDREHSSPRGGTELRFGPVEFRPPSEVSDAR